MFNNHPEQCNRITNFVKTESLKKSYRTETMPLCIGCWVLRIAYISRRKVFKYMIIR